MVIKIVIRYADGRLRKGTTQDFFPNKDNFHMIDKDSGQVHAIDVRDLKAVFFVKSFEGNPKYEDRFDVERVGLGRKIRVHFKDNEKMIGYTQGFSPNRAGFILFPADPECNNDKVFVVTAATTKVEFI